MKKVFFLALAVLLSGCSKKDDIPEKVYMSGKWTQVNEQSMTSGYIEFQEGKMARYISSIGEVVAMEDALWHCSSSDFTEESVCSYYIQDKCLYVDGKPSGRMEDDELYIDDKLYCSFNDFEEDYYVTIVPDVTDNVITLTFCAAEQEFSVSLTRSLPHSSLSVSTSDEWIKSLGLDEGNVSFVTEAPVEDREGAIRISYPGAADKVVSVMQKCERFIRPAVTEMSFDCISREVSLSYMIENPVEGEVLTVTTDAEWISEIRVEKDRVVVLLASNEDGTAREAVLRLSYKEANPVEVKVSQSFPNLTLSQETQETDYSSKTLSFTYSVNNAAEGQVLEAVSGVAWISGIAVDGNTVTYIVSENNSGSSRSGEITLTYAGVVRTFTVTQSYSASVLRLTQSEGGIDYAGGTYEFGWSVTNEREGESVRATSISDWITGISVSGGKVSYKIGLNATGKSRTAEIVVKYSTATATYKVTQSAAEFTLSESSASHGYASASGTIGYNIANRHDSQQLKLSTTASWITGLTDSNGSVRYYVSENNSGSSRSGEITLTYAGVVRTFTVTQSYSASTITLSSGSQTTDYTSKKLNFTVNITNPRENLSLSGKATAEWIQDLTINGNTVSYTVDKNISVNQREATITINYENDTKKFKTIQTGHPVTELTLNKTSVTLLAGESEILAASAFPLDTKVQWSSSSPAIASVDQNGKVTGLDNGTTIITVASADGTKTARCEVTVIVPVTGVSLDRTSAEIIKGESMTLTATVAPSNATNKNVIWTSSDPSVATVSQSGVITAIKAGSTTVVATTIDGEKAAACEIVVIVPVNSISLDKESLELIEGDGASLTATIGPDDATDKRIIWKSSDDSIAIVSSSGAVVAVKAGTVTITATTNDGGFTAECNLTVIKRVVSGGIEDTKDDNWGM